MKINWFSPLLPARTDIAHYTARILPALESSAQITLWTHQPEWDRELENHARVRRIDLRRPPWPELNQADVNFYNIGNNPLYHGAIWQVSLQQPGIVVLHDFHLHHFFDGLYRAQWRDLKGYMNVMGFYYGEEGRRSARESYMNQGRDIDRMAQLYPLTRLALRNAFGVVTHTREAYEDLRSETSLLAAYAPLPFAARDVRRERPAKRDEAQSFRLIVFGHIGRNRRLDALLDALSHHPARDRFRLDIYGEVEEMSRLRSRIRKLELKKLVHVHGFVPEAELERALAEADLAVNLRYPTVGEASGSQLRIWAHQLPALVTRIGWYGTLPPDVVAHVRPEHEVADISEHLSALVNDPARFAAMGERGLEMLEREHAPLDYVRTLLELAREAQTFRARAYGFKLARRAASLMSPWMKETRTDENATARVAAQIHALTCGKDEREF